MSLFIRVLGLALALAAPPAVHAAEWDDLLTGYALTSWHEDAGRAIGSVHGIAQDADGYLWIAAEGGLLRFDGSRFTPWDSLGELGVPAAPARSVWVAPDGTIWVGFAQGHGVGRIQGGRFTPHRDGLVGIDAITDIVGDNDGVLWTVGDRTLFRFDGTSWHKAALPWTGVEGPVYHPYVARNGQMWVATRWGVFRRDAGTGAFTMVNDDLVWGLGEDASGRIWATEIASGFRPLDAAPPRHPLQGGGYRLIHDRHNQLWLSTFGAGLWHVSHDGGSVVVRRAITRTGLSSDSVQAIFEDRDGNLWVGTTAGLHRLTRRRLTPIDDIGAVLATAPAPGGRLWVGTASGLLLRSLSAEGADAEWIGGSAPDIRTFYTDSAGVLWMGTGDGLWRLDGRRLEKVRIPERSEMLVRWLAPDGHGGFWLCDADWLYHWNGRRLRPFAAPGIDGARIRFTAADRQGRVWVGLSTGRVAYIDERGTFRHVGEDNGLPDGTHTSINAIFEDRTGAVWIGGTGVSRFAGERVTTLTSANGLPPGRVWAIVDDEPGNLWLTMDHGLVRLARGEVARALDDPGYRMRYDAYGARDGVAGSAVGIINATRAANGSLWFAQGGGLTHADPQQLPIQRETAAPRAQIAVVIANETRALPTRTSFPAGTRRLEIQYSAPTLGNTNRVRFRYRLDGVDSGWVDAGADRTAVYTNLAAGAYRFRVESLVEGGSTTSAETVWSFAIQPLFYETGWFAALVAAAVVVAVWGVWRVRLRFVRRQFALALAERARLSREIHDTLLQSLVGVALQVDAVSGSLDPTSTSVRQQLVRIRRQVEQYIRDARQSILDLRSPQLEHQDLATALREFGRSAIGDASIRFSVAVNGAPASYPPRTENQLLRIGREAITNAVRHAGAARIKVELTADARTVTLSVADDGRGFDYDAAQASGNDHYGLRTMRERAEELGGTLAVTSAPGRGTIVTALVPTSVVAREELLAEL